MRSRISLVLALAGVVAASGYWLAANREALLGRGPHCGCPASAVECSIPCSPCCPGAPQGCHPAR